MTMANFPKFAFAASVMLLLNLLWMPNTSQAHTIDMPPYKVYYQALGTDFLSADIAKRYKIVRSKYQGFVNISLHKNDEAVTAAIEGSAKNLLSQSQSLEFREIRDGEAIYYIALFKYNNLETMQFDIEVMHKNSTPIKVKFDQTFYVE